jgi:hypothetical protein
MDNERDAKEKTKPDYSLPQGCPADIEPHMPDACRDPEHAILAMTDDEYARFRSGRNQR